MTLTELEDVVVAELDEWFAEDVPCGGTNDHPAGRFGHVPEQAATWLYVSPCRRVPVCGAWVARTMALPGVVGCLVCGGRHDITDLRFIPL